MIIKKLSTASFGMKYPEFFPKTRTRIENQRQAINEMIDILLENKICPFLEKIQNQIQNIIK